MRAEIDTELAAQAREAGVGLRDAAEMGLRIALAAAEARARQWALDNAEAISLHNERVAERGLFGEDLRRW